MSAAGSGNKEGAAALQAETAGAAEAQAIPKCNFCSEPTKFICPACAGRPVCPQCHKKQEHIDCCGRLPASAQRALCGVRFGPLHSRFTRCDETQLVQAAERWGETHRAVTDAQLRSHGVKYTFPDICSSEQLGQLLRRVAETCPRKVVECDCAAFMQLMCFLHHEGAEGGAKSSSAKGGAKGSSAKGGAKSSAEGGAKGSGAKGGNEACLKLAFGGVEVWERVTERHRRNFFAGTPMQVLIGAMHRDPVLRTGIISSMSALYLTYPKAVECVANKSSSWSGLWLTAVHKNGRVRLIAKDDCGFVRSTRSLQEWYTTALTQLEKEMQGRNATGPDSAATRDFQTFKKRGLFAFSEARVLICGMAFSAASFDEAMRTGRFDLVRLSAD